MIPDLTKIFPECKSSVLIDVLDTNSICDTENSMIKTLVNNHIYAKSIQLFSTSSSTINVAKEFVCSNNENEYYLVENMPLYALIHPNFIENFVKNGNVVGLSGMFLFFRVNFN